MANATPQMLNATTKTRHIGRNAAHPVAASVSAIALSEEFIPAYSDGVSDKILARADFVKEPGLAPIEETASRQSRVDEDCLAACGVLPVARVGLGSGVDRVSANHESIR